MPHQGVLGKQELLSLKPFSMDELLGSAYRTLPLDGLAYGQARTKLPLTVKRNGLTLGTYTAKVKLTFPDTTIEPILIPVSIKIVKP